jgi:hypothetical protein
MLPASAGSTAAKVLVCVFCIMYFLFYFYLLNSPLGVREKKLGFQLGSDLVILSRFPMFRRLVPVLFKAAPALVCGLATASTSIPNCKGGSPATFPTHLQNQAGELVDSRVALKGKHVLLYFRRVHSSIGLLGL